jgi:hypothetical protein
LSFYRNEPTSHVYILDHFIFSNIDLQIKLWNSEQKCDDTRFPEKFLQESYTEKTDLELGELKTYFSDFYDLCVKNDIKLYFTKIEYINHEELIKAYENGRKNAYLPQ